MRGVRSASWWLAAGASLAIVAAGCGKHAKPTEPAGAPRALVTDGAVQVGGEDAVTVERVATVGATGPEFVSATVLPGRGFNLFQITANLPGRGEVKLLASPSLEDAAGKLNGGPGDPNGTGSFSFGGAFLVPYPNRILGKPVDNGTMVETSWQGHTLDLPADWSGKNAGAQKHAIHGLILASQVKNVQKTKTEDGETVTGFLHAGNFGGHWLSQTDLKFSVGVAAQAVVATVTATNVGGVAEPISIGWHPYFAIPSGDRSQVRLRVPATEVTQVNNYDDVFPTGKLLPVAGGKYDFNAEGGKALGDVMLDDNFSGLQRENGAVDVELSDPEGRYGLRVKGLSPQIKTVQVYAPPTRPVVAIEPQFNFNDPFGSEWHGMDTGMVVLQPGQSVTWKVRLELFVPPGAGQAVPQTAGVQ